MYLPLMRAGYDSSTTLQSGTGCTERVAAAGL